MGAKDEEEKGERRLTFKIQLLELVQEHIY